MGSADNKAANALVKEAEYSSTKHHLLPEFLSKRQFKELQ